MAKEKVRHPPGLYVLFGTEAAERFSFYTMRAVLVLYLTRIILPGAFATDDDFRAKVSDALSTDAAAVYTEIAEGVERATKAKLDQAFTSAGVEPATFFAAVVQRQAGGIDALLEAGFSKQNLKGEEEQALEAAALASIGGAGGAGDGVALAEWVVALKIKSEIRPEALSIYGLYLLLVYLCGLIGGYVADKILGSRKAIMMGGIVMGAGLFVMWWPAFVFYGLGLIIAGNAFFKPNISTIVSGLYPEDDKRRDPAFTIFYMGINLGAFIAIFGAGYAESLAQTHDWGWNVGFVLAGVGMIFSLMLFQLGQRYLGTAGFPPGREVTEESRLNARDFRDVLIWAVGVGAFAIGVVALYGLVGPIWNDLPTAAKVIIGLGLITAAIFGLRARGKKEGGESNEPLTIEEWQRIAVIMILSVFVIFFWAGFEQAGGTMNLFAYEQTDRHIGSWEMPATWFQGFNPLFIFILAPVFSMIWGWNDRQSWGLSTPAKMGVGMIVLGLGFIVMYFGQQEADAVGKASLVWLVMVYLIHTVGELCLSPIGLSMVTKLSPVRIVSLMMGVWFACTAVADYLSGRMEEIVHHLGFDLWVVLFTIPIGAGIVLLAITPVLKKWMHGRG